jgi:hypothetical protein
MSANAGYLGVTQDTFRSVSLWVKVPTVSGVPDESTTGSLVYWGSDSLSGGTHGRCWSIELKNGKPRLWIRGAHITADAVADDRTVVDDGEWHLLVFQFQQGVNIEDVEIWVDDYGRIDTQIFGAGTTVFTTNNASPFTIGARNLGGVHHYFVERDLQLEQIAVWKGELSSTDVTFLWNRGHDGATGLEISGTDGSGGKQYSPAGLSGTVELDAWYSFDSPYKFTNELFNVAPPGSRSLDVINGATWINDTPSSGIFPQ